MIKKSELYERIKYLEEVNQRLTVKLESEQQIRWGETNWSCLQLLLQSN